MMMMDETSLSYSSSLTSNESSSSLTSTSDDYLSSSTDSVKPTVTKIILKKIRLGNFGAVQKEVAVYSYIQPFRMTFNVIQEELLIILIYQIQLIYKCQI